ncbi:MAG: hypothetical protein K0U61_08975 [Alphaproteobacteria bacterium]|nr:hypothetical protein [Alphaproteobacteria bacterium]
MAPTAAISAPDGAIADEGQVLLVDASASSDPEGTTLSFSWTQTGGPAAAMSSMTSAQIDITLPEVSTDETMTFQVQVSDGELTATEAIDLSATNIVEAPIYGSFDNPVEILSGLPGIRGLTLTETMRSGSAIYSLIGAQEQNGQMDLLYFERNVDGTYDPADRTATGVSSSGTVVGRDGYFGFEGSGATFIFEDAGKIAFYNEQQGSPPLYEAGSTDLDAPCGFSTILYGTGQLIGHRDSGLTSITRSYSGASPNLTTSVEVSKPTNTGTYCFFGTNLPANRLISAYNSDTDAVEVWSREFDPSQTPNSQFELIASVDVNLPTGLSVVDFGSANGFDGSQETSFSVILATDGVHDGQHIAILLHWTAALGFERDELTWSKGIPSDVVVGDANIPNWPILISTSSSPFLRVYDAPAPFWAAPLAGLYSDPAFMEVGLGSTELVVDGSREPIIVLNQPSKDQVVVLTDTPP